MEVLPHAEDSRRLPGALGRTDTYREFTESHAAALRESRSGASGSTVRHHAARTRGFEGSLIVFR